MTQPGLAAVQFEPDPGEPDANLDTIDSHAGSLPNGTALAVFPELCVTGYDLDAAVAAAQPVPGPWTDELVQTAERVGLHLAVGLPEADGDSVYNSLAYITPTGVEVSYRKQYLWGDEPGRLSVGADLSVVEATFGRVGLLVCYDLNFPELGVAYAREAVDVLAVSSAWRTPFRHDWRLLTRARGLDGSCYVVASNHVGDQRGREHAGHSHVAGPTGTMLEETGEQPGAAVAAFSREALDEARQRNPVHRDRRAAEWPESSTAR